jgi:hypothetical protein
MRKTKKRKPIFVPFLIYGNIFHGEPEVTQPFAHIGQMHVSYELHLLLMLEIVLVLQEFLFERSSVQELIGKMVLTEKLNGIDRQLIYFEITGVV